MRNMCLGITAFVVTVGMVSVGAQGRNFSGTWIIDSEKTMAAAQAAGETTRSAGGVGVGGMITAAGGGGGAAAGAVVAGGGRARGTSSGEGSAGGGGVAVGGTLTAAGTGEVRAVRGGGGGGVGVATDMIITMDSSTFTLEQAGRQTSYPLNGTEVIVPTRGDATAKAKASWKGDTLVIEQTMDTPNGPVTSTTSWFLEGESLVRLTTRRTYFKKK